MRTPEISQAAAAAAETAETSTIARQQQQQHHQPEIDLMAAESDFNLGMHANILRCPRGLLCKAAIEHETWQLVETVKRCACSFLPSAIIKDSVVLYGLI